MAPNIVSTVLDSFNGQTGAPPKQIQASQFSALIQPPLEQCASFTETHFNRIHTEELGQMVKAWESSQLMKNCWKAYVYSIKMEFWGTLQFFGKSEDLVCNERAIQTHQKKVVELRVTMSGIPFLAMSFLPLISLLSLPLLLFFVLNAISHPFASH